MSRGEEKVPRTTFAEQVKAASGALRQARAVGYDRVIRQDGPRGYVVTAKDEKAEPVPASSRAPALVD